MRERSRVGGYFLDWVARDVSSEEVTIGSYLQDEEGSSKDGEETVFGGGNRGGEWDGGLPLG